MSAAFLEWLADRGDPSLFSWIVTIGYLVAALLCWRAGAASGDERRFWRCLALILMLGGLNKQLDLQTLMIALAREAVTGTRWFAERRTVQASFVVVLGAATLAAGVWLSRHARRWQPPAHIACLGAVAIALFWLLRAAAINHVAGDDGTIGHGRILQAVEAIGVVLTAAGAALERHQAGSSQGARI